MTLKCFTCGDPITFDDSVVSKTGKKIPLWLDKLNTHGHDDDGNPVRGDLPETQQQQPPHQPSNFKPFPAPAAQQQPRTTQGGASLDTRRTIQALTELMTEVREIKEILNSRISRYEPL